MKGYLLTEQQFTVGEATFVESISSENSYAVVFEDDTETGYFYAMELDADGGQQILDAVHVYECDNIEAGSRPGIINILWSTDWLKCGLLINNYCHAVFDFAQHGGYCRNAFPPPNETWTKGDRLLTDAMVKTFFS